MSLGYSVNLYFPVEQIEEALVSTARTAHLADNISTPVTLPSRKVISVPFTSNFKTDALTLEHQNKGSLDCLDTSLWFPTDETIRTLFSERTTEIVDGKEWSAIGYIYLYIHVGCLFAEFSYTAATSRISRLFVDCPLVRGCAMYEILASFRPQSISGNRPVGSKENRRRQRAHGRDVAIAGGGGPDAAPALHAQLRQVFSTSVAIACRTNARLRLSADLNTSSRPAGEKGRTADVT